MSGSTARSKKAIELRYVLHHEHTYVIYPVCIFRDDVLQDKDVILVAYDCVAAIKRTAGRVGQTRSVLGLRCDASERATSRVL